MISLLFAIPAFAGVSECRSLAEAMAIDPKRFEPYACEKFVEYNKDKILRLVAKGGIVHCEMTDNGPVLKYFDSHDKIGGSGVTGCPYPVFNNKIQKCKGVQGPVPKWAKGASK